MSETNLYGVSVTTDDYPGYTGVTFELWRHRGDPPFRVDDYMPPRVLDEDDDFYLRDAIRELFTREEALTLVDFFTTEAYPHTRIELHRVDPRKWPSSMIGHGAMPSGGGVDHYMFDDPAGEDQPPVSVWGYFDLRCAAESCADDPEPDVADLFAADRIEQPLRLV